MVRNFAFAVALLAMVCFTGSSIGADKPVKQGGMVKGTIKSSDAGTSVLIINQKVKDETVERQLSITGTTEWEINDGTEKKTGLLGKDGLIAIEGKTGATVAVKCDKDVNVLKVTVTFKK